MYWDRNAKTDDLRWSFQFYSFQKSNALISIYWDTRPGRNDKMQSPCSEHLNQWLLWIEQNLKNGLLSAERAFPCKKLNSETLNTIPWCDFLLVHLYTLEDSWGEVYCSPEFSASVLQQCWLFAKSPLSEPNYPLPFPSEFNADHTFIKNIEGGTSPAVQCLRICLPMRGTLVWSLIGEWRSHTPWGN